MAEHQRRAADRLRRDLSRADGSLQHPYFRSLTRQLRTYIRAVNLSDLIAAASLAEIIYVGDFHARPEFQRFAADLLQALAPRVRRLALGVEFVYSRQQRLLDQRQREELSDLEFRRRVHYREEWGYPWEGYRDLLDRARSLQVPVHALDAPPRGGKDSLVRRDAHAACQIVRILRRQPGARMLVLFGESHVARSRLPRRTKGMLKRAGLERRELMIFQSPDRIYWQLLAQEGPLPEVVQVDAATYAVIHASPLEKYEAYRQVLERWHGDLPPDEEIDLTPAVHHLIDVLLRWIGIRAPNRRVRHRAGWSEDLVDAFPEVYSGADASELLEPILEEHGRSAEEIDESRKELSERGGVYDSRSNTIFLIDYRPSAAAGEAARFLRAALTGRLFIAADEFAEDPAVATYGAAYNEALAYLGAKLVDPTVEYPATSGQPPPRPAGEGARPLAESIDSETSRWLDAHRAYERSRRAEPPDPLLASLRRSRPLRRRLALDLGRRLGQGLFRRVREGRLDQRRLRRLFTRPLVPESTARQVVRLLRGS